MINAPVTPLGDGRFLVQEPGRPQRLAWAARDRGVTWVFFEGRAYRIADNRPSGPSTSAPAAAEDDALALSAPMPATVTAVHVTPGQRVSAGDALLTLEAMKMELPIVAPHDGVVTTIACAVGDLVQPGVPLAAIE
jgi:biotin carboxyl carrier protein